MKAAVGQSELVISGTIVEEYRHSSTSTKYEQVFTAWVEKVIHYIKFACGSLIALKVTTSDAVGRIWDARIPKARLATKSSGS